MLNRVTAMLATVDSSHPALPPTALYNEGWMLRLVLDWFNHNQKFSSHPLAFGPGSHWFSEGLLPSQFLARFRGDPLAENWTHADSIIGHFTIGAMGKVDIALEPAASHFMVAEAKLFSLLSAGTARILNFDQAARNVACIAEVLRRAGRLPQKLSRLGFYVLAPREQVSRGLFAEQMSRGSIRTKVEQRVAAYEGEKDHWFQEWFLPTLEFINVATLCWEEVITHISAEDPATGRELEQFYDRCLQYNRTL